MPSDSVNSAYSLRPNVFVAAVVREVKSHYAALERDLTTEVRYRLAKFWWGEGADIHYELALHERTLQIELGLHFEASAESNRRLLAAFSPHLIEIQQVLGDSIWLEEWDRGWTRIYETLPLLPLDEERVMFAAARLCEIIDCLQPILDVVE